MRTTTTLLAIASCLWGGFPLASPAQMVPPAQLTLLGEQGGYKIYLDPSSIVRSRPLVRLKIRVVSPDQRQGAAASVTDLSIDCGAELIRVFEITGYNRQGKILGSRTFSSNHPPMLVRELGELSTPLLQAVCPP